MKGYPDQLTSSSLANLHLFAFNFPKQIFPPSFAERRASDNYSMSYVKAKEELAKTTKKERPTKSERRARAKNYAKAKEELATTTKSERRATSSD
jgi:hypothetical protein